MIEDTFIQPQSEFRIRCISGTRSTRTTWPGAAVASIQRGVIDKR